MIGSTSTPLVTGACSSLVAIISETGNAGKRQYLDYRLKYWTKRFEDERESQAGATTWSLPPLFLQRRNHAHLSHTQSRTYEKFFPRLIQSLGPELVL